MNSTGYRLNNQELRNAQFFGEFKTLAFTLAAEQLYRWRKWKVFSESKIARMLEVETTSDLMTLIIKGISEKDKRTLDKMYEQFDENFPNSSIVARRFRMVMDTIDEQFASKTLRVLESVALFYCLFAAVYDKHYGIKSPLTSKKAKSIPKATVEQMICAATTLMDGTAPPRIQLLTERRTHHVRERKALTEYILG
jgi:hypothetical protein